MTKDELRDYMVTLGKGGKIVGARTTTTHSARA